MKLSLLNIQRVIFIFLSILVYGLTYQYIHKKDSYQTTLIGVIYEIKQTTGESYIIKFKGTPDYNILSKMKFDEELKKGDSIYKPMFSNDWFIYRKNQRNDYELFYKTKSK